MLPISRTRPRPVWSVIAVYEAAALVALVAALVADVAADVALVAAAAALLDAVVA